MKRVVWDKTAFLHEHAGGGDLPCSSCVGGLVAKLSCPRVEDFGRFYEVIAFDLLPSRLRPELNRPCRELDVGERTNPRLLDVTRI